MAGPFDDLIPQQPQAQGAFDDLIPPPTAAPSQLREGTYRAPDGSISDFDQSNPGAESAPTTHQPGIIERLAGALAHPVQTVEDAWNAPGYLTPKLADALVNSAASSVNAFNGGKIDLSDPQSVTANIPSMMTAAALASPTSAASTGSAIPASAIPTADALHAAGGAGFDAMRDSGVEFAPQAVASRATEIKQGLVNDGVLPNLAPRTHAILDDLAQPPSGAVSAPISYLDAARKGLVNAGATADSTERMAAGRAKSGLLDFIQNPPPQAIVAGASAAPGASDALRDGIANSAAGFRSDALNNVERAADLRSAAANSGANIGNTTRQRVASLLLNPKASGGYNDAETSALESVVQGSPASNTARRLANVLGGGGGLGHGLAATGGAVVGGMLGGEMGAGIGAGAAATAGPALKAIQNHLDTGALTRADELVRQRSPLYRQNAANAPQTPVFPSAPAQALTRALLAQQNQP